MILLHAAAMYCALTPAAASAWVTWVERMQGRILQPGDPHSILKLLSTPPGCATARHSGASRPPPRSEAVHAGVAWAAWFEHVQGRILETDPETAAKLEGVARQPDATVAEGGDEVPWRAFLRNTPVRALAYTHFCNNWWVAVQQQVLLCTSQSTWCYSPCTAYS